MSIDLVLYIGREALLLALLLSAPPVLVALAIGLLVSVVQAATQIQEQTLTFVPKLIGVSLTLAFMGLWAIRVLSQYSSALFEDIPRWVR